MGIRFRCQHCDFELHVKDFQAGKRGKCPRCAGSLRIPEKTPSPSSIEQVATVTDTGEPFAEAGSNTESARESEAVASPKTADTFPEPTAPESAEQIPAETSPADRPVPPPAPNSPAQPKAIAENPDGVWYLRIASGDQYGPANSDTFLQWMIENRVTKEALVWCDGWPDWLSASDVFSDYYGTQKTSPPASAPATPSHHTQPNRSHQNRTERREQKKRRHFISLVILGIVSIILLAALVAVLVMQM